ncbi:hypothetical protein BY996DRAFT_6412901 [Phakopsora pachyrhizi]|nr:hypothetical protein BY996DRAFT_6412901 [Phakopsora pachyrhizi]
MTNGVIGTETFNGSISDDYDDDFKKDQNTGPESNEISVPSQDQLKNIDVETISTTPLSINTGLRSSSEGIYDSKLPTITTPSQSSDQLSKSSCKRRRTSEEAQRLRTEQDIRRQARKEAQERRLLEQQSRQAEKLARQQLKLEQQAKKVPRFFWDEENSLELLSFIKILRSEYGVEDDQLSRSVPWTRFFRGNQHRKANFKLLENIPFETLERRYKVLLNTYRTIKSSSDTNGADGFIDELKRHHMSHRMYDAIASTFEANENSIDVPSGAQGSELMMGDYEFERSQDQKVADSISTQDSRKSYKLQSSTNHSNVERNTNPNIFENDFNINNTQSDANSNNFQNDANPSKQNNLNPDHQIHYNFTTEISQVIATSGSNSKELTGNLADLVSRSDPQLVLLDRLNSGPEELKGPTTSNLQVSNLLSQSPNISQSSICQSPRTPSSLIAQSSSIESNNCYNLLLLIRQGQERAEERALRKEEKDAEERKQSEALRTQERQERMAREEREARRHEQMMVMIMGLFGKSGDPNGNVINQFNNSNS